MHRMTTSRFYLVCLLTSLLSGITQTASGFSFSFSSHSSQNSGNSSRTTTNRPWGNLGAFKPGLQSESNYTSDPNGYSYSYSYQTTNNGTENGYYLGAAPGTGWPGVMNPAMNPMMPSQQAYIPATAYAGYPGQMAATATAGQPSVEVEVSESSPFEQQNIVYTVRVVSSDNLKTLNPILPRIEGAALQKVDGPAASLRTDKRSGNQKIVNTYHFKLTPLRSWRNRDTRYQLQGHTGVQQQAMEWHAGHATDSSRRGGVHHSFIQSGDPECSAGGTSRETLAAVERFEIESAVVE